MNDKNFSKKCWPLFLFALITLIIVAFVPPIPQNLGYHDFADKRTFFHIVNFNDVASNCFFFLIGVLGIYRLWLNNNAKIDGAMKYALNYFFMALILLGIGSAYYHLHPNNMRLVWDRLPINIALMALLDFMISERINKKWGLYLLVPLLIVGISSVIYWHQSELQGHGDLRWYAWTQNIAPLTIFAILYLFPHPQHMNKNLFLALGFFILAKICEWQDKPIFNLSLHTIY